VNPAQPAYAVRARGRDEGLTGAQVALLDEVADVGHC